MLNYKYFETLTEKPDFLKRIKSGKVIINFTHDNEEALEIKIDDKNAKEYFEQDMGGINFKPNNVLLVEVNGESISETQLKIMYRLMHNVQGLNITVYDSNRPDVDVSFYDVVIRDKKAYLVFREYIDFQ